MSHPPSNRIGCVPYLNARPLIRGIEDRVTLDIPSTLARRLREGKLDAALVPVAEYLENPHYQIVPGISIASRGPVLSVYLASRVPLPRLTTIAPDPASRTSNLLLQVILAEFFRIHPRCVSDAASCEARLWIGDPALTSRARLAHEGWELHDLGALWHEKTGLPFVYAFWAVREGLDALPYLRVLTEAKARGLRELDAILDSETVLPRDLAKEYLTRHIRYDLGSDEIRGLLEFQRLCARHGLIAGEVTLKLAA